MLCPRIPLSTLRRHPCGCQRMTRGRRDWLDLQRTELASAATCRSSRRRKHINKLWTGSESANRGGEASQRQAGGAHLPDQLGRTLRVEAAAQQLAHLGGLGVELVAERSDVIAMAGELRLQVVDPPRQYGLDDRAIDWLHACLEPGLERSREVATDLQRRLQFGGQQRRR